MASSYEDIPRRIFLDSCALQTLLTYGGFIYENEELAETDRIHGDPLGVSKLEALRNIMHVAERAPFEFALSENSFVEVGKVRDHRYLQWAYDVLDHWLVCLEENQGPAGDARIAELVDTAAYNYLGAGDRALIKDAVLLGCDAFLTMENRLPRQADHIRRMLNLSVLSPVSMWDILRPWAALFR